MNQSINENEKRDCLNYLTAVNIYFLLIVKLKYTYKIKLLYQLYLFCLLY